MELVLFKVPLNTGIIRPPSYYFLSGVPLTLGPTLLKSYAYLPLSSSTRLRQYAANLGRIGGLTCHTNFSSLVMAGSLLPQGDCTL